MNANAEDMLLLDRNDQYVCHFSMSSIFKVISTLYTNMAALYWRNNGVRKVEIVEHRAEFCLNNIISPTPEKKLDNYSNQRLCFYLNYFSNQFLWTSQL